MEMWIGFDPLSVFAWGTYVGQVQSSDPLSDWTNLQSQYANGPGASLGTVGNGGVSSITLGQIHSPPTFPANTSNPIMIWSGEWSSGDLTPRVVDVTTVTTKCLGYGGIHIHNITFDDPTVQIQVVPAPPALAFLVISCGFASRRRRYDDRRVARADSLPMLVSAR